MKPITIITALAIIFLVACERNDQTEKNTVLSEEVFELELKKNKKGSDVLVLTVGQLPRPEQEKDKYDYYLCWLDEPAPKGGYSFEKRMELRGTTGGGKGANIATIGLNAVYFEQGRSYYGRGRVCAIIASNNKSYITNVLRVPDAPDETAMRAAEDLAARKVDQQTPPNK